MGHPRWRPRNLAHSTRPRTARRLPAQPEMNRRATSKAETRDCEPVCVTSGTHVAKTPPPEARPTAVFYLASTLSRITKIRSGVNSPCASDANSPKLRTSGTPRVLAVINAAAPFLVRIQKTDLSPVRSAWEQPCRGSSQVLKRGYAGCGLRPLSQPGI